MNIFPKDTTKPGEKLTEADYKKAANTGLIIAIVVYILAWTKINLGLLTIIPLIAMAYIFKFAQRGLRSKDKGTLLKAKITRIMGYIYWILIAIGILYLVLNFFSAMTR